MIFIIKVLWNLIVDIQNNKQDDPTLKLEQNSENNKVKSVSYIEWNKSTKMSCPSPCDFPQ